MRSIITRFISIICIVNYNIQIIIVKVFAEDGRVSEIYSINNKLLVILLFNYSNLEKQNMIIPISIQVGMI